MTLSVVMGIIRLAEYIFLAFVFGFWAGGDKS